MLGIGKYILTPQNIIGPLHSKELPCACSRIPSIGVPPKRETATIEKAIPIRTLGKMSIIRLIHRFNIPKFSWAGA
jgi:hypothetical protein